jgi:dolichol-phosphate mannosyltransferase
LWLGTQAALLGESGLKANEIKAYSRKVAIIPSCHNTKQLVEVIGNFQENTVNEICIVIDCANKSDLQQVENAAFKNRIPIHVINSQKRRGVGVAIRDGIEYALNNKYDIAVVMAGNGKDKPREIPRLLIPILAEDFDYVQGSRFLPGGKPVKTPFLRGMFSRLFPFVWTLLTSKRCTDVTNGFRAYKLNIFYDKHINIQQGWLDGYQFEYYLHYKVLTLGYKVKEVPVSKVYYFRNRGGYSNISPLRDWWKIVGPLVYLKLGIKQ